MQIKFSPSLYGGISKKVRPFDEEADSALVNVCRQKLFNENRRLCLFLLDLAHTMHTGVDECVISADMLNEAYQSM